MMVVNNPLIRPYFLEGWVMVVLNCWSFVGDLMGTTSQTIDIAVWEWWFRQQLHKKKRMYSIFPWEWISTLNSYKWSNQSLQRNVDFFGGENDHCPWMNTWHLWTCGQKRPCLPKDGVLPLIETGEPQLHFGFKNHMVGLWYAKPR